MKQFISAGDVIFNMNHCIMAGIAPDVRDDVTVYGLVLHFPGAIFILEPSATKEEALNRFLEGLDTGQLPPVVHIVSQQPPQQVTVPRPRKLS